MQICEKGVHLLLKAHNLIMNIKCIVSAVALRAQSFLLSPIANYKIPTKILKFKFT